MAGHVVCTVTSPQPSLQQCKKGASVNGATVTSAATEECHSRVWQFTESSSLFISVPATPSSQTVPPRLQQESKRLCSPGAEDTSCRTCFGRIKVTLRSPWPRPLWPSGGRQLSLLEWGRDCVALVPWAYPERASGEGGPEVPERMQGKLRRTCRSPASMLKAPLTSGRFANEAAEDRLKVPTHFPPTKGMWRPPRQGVARPDSRLPKCPGLSLDSSKFPKVFMLCKASRKQEYG